MQGIEIYINEQKADTDGISFSMTINSPIMDIDGSMKGDYVYSLSFRRSENNDYIFKYPMRFSKIDNLKEFSIKCFHYGTYLFSGVCTVLSANAKSISTNVKFGSGQFWYELSETKINSLDLGKLEVSTFQSQILLMQFASGANDGSVNVPIRFPMLYAPKFYGEADDNGLSNTNISYGQGLANEVIEKCINNWNTDVQMFYLNAIQSEEKAINVNTLVPMFQVQYILDQLVKKYGYVASGRIFREDIFKNILSGNNKNLDYKDLTNYYIRASKTSDSSVQFSENTYLLEFDDKTTEPNEDNENYYDTHKNEYNTPTAGTYRIYGKIILDFYTNLMDVVLDSFVLMVYIDGVNESNFTMSAVYNNAENTYELEYDTTVYAIGSNRLISTYFLLDAFNNNASYYVKSGSFINIDRIDVLNNMKNEIIVSKHLPDITAKEYIKNISLSLACFPFLRKIDNSIEFIFFNDILQSPDYVEFSENIIEGPELLENDCTGFTFDFEYDQDKDQDFKDVSKYSFLGSFQTMNDLPKFLRPNYIVYVRNLNSYFIYDTKISGLTKWKYLSYNELYKIIENGDADMKLKYLSPIMTIVKDCLMPKINSECISELFGDNSDTSFFLLNWIGMQENKSGNLYPMASTDIYDYAGNEIGSFAINFNHEKGLINSFLKNWINAKLNSKPIRIKKLMTGPELKAIDLSKKHRVFGIDYIIRSHTPEITENRLIKVEFTLDSI